MQRSTTQCENEKKYASLKTAVFTALSLYAVEGTAIVFRMTETPVDLPLRLAAAHVALILPIFLCIKFFKILGYGLSVGYFFTLGMMILTSGNDVLHPVPIISGTLVLLLLTLFWGKSADFELNKRNSGALFFTTAFASLAAKGSLLESGGWMNVVWGSLWFFISVGIFQVFGAISKEKGRYRYSFPLKVIYLSLIAFTACWGFFSPETELPEFSPKENAGGQNVVLIIIDTVRPEALLRNQDCEPLMPNLLKYAESKAMLPYFTVPAPSSLPTHATLFTGYPSSIHGAHKPRFDDPDPPFYAYKLSKKLPTLAERLSSKGYVTAAVSGNFGPLSPRYGLNQGFDYYDAERNEIYKMIQKTLLFRCIPIRRIIEDFPFPVFGYDTATPYRNGKRITDKAIALLRNMKKTQPFFLFVNIFDAHSPYLPPEYWKLRKKIAGSGWIRDGEPIEKIKSKLLKTGSALTKDELNFLWTLYQHELQYVDRCMIRLLNEINHSDTLVVILSDHGESMGEHGLLKHSNTLYTQEIQVPCIISTPENKQHAEALTVKLPENCLQLHDLILRAAGLSPPQRPDDPGLVAEVFGAEHPRTDISGRNIFEGDLKCLIQYPWKLIHHSDGNHQLFDLSKMKMETVDCSSERKKLTQKMAAELELYLASYDRIVIAGERLNPVLDHYQKDALKSLGYVD